MLPWSSSCETSHDRKPKRRKKGLIDRLRKNWLFSGHPRGADASATLYSLIETAKANGLEPYRYLRHLFEHLPAAITDAQRKALLPQYIDPQSLIIPA